MICGNCHQKETNPGFFCDHCHYLKDPKQICQRVTYFEAFNWYIFRICIYILYIYIYIYGHLNFSDLVSKEEYELDIGALEEKYHQLQLELHPDKFATLEEELMEMATAYSSFINEAYHILKDNIHRAHYLVLYIYIYIYSSSCMEYKLIKMNISQIKNS